MLESFGTLLNAVKAAGTPIYSAVCLAACAALFLPDRYLLTLGLQAFRDQNRAYVGIALIVCTSLLLVECLIKIRSKISRLLAGRRFRKNVYTTLTELTWDEKSLLRPFIINGENTIFSPINGGVAEGLQAKSVIFRSSTISHGFDFPYNLQPIARRILTENQYLLD